ncbi:MAG: ATP-binding protein [Parabacteroides sp.]|nr:ATP-binding protein [Parabacteroides sp.]
MRTVIYNQRLERDKLCSQPYLLRQTSYPCEELLQNHAIKLITGPRRAGKSTQAILMLRDTNFAYLNFDDSGLLKNWDEEEVEHLLQEIYPAFDYLMLDEVQNLPAWDLWVAKLYRRGMNIVITGSNANLLSGEMATLLTGRYIEINLLPFSLQETLDWNTSQMNVSQPPMQPSLIKQEYLLKGGYPESVMQRSVTELYLSTLFDAIILKDIVRRHRIRKVEELNSVAQYLLANFCNPLSANDIRDSLELSSVATTQKFMGYLQEPFLFYYLHRYNNKLKLMKKAPNKIYVVDNGFILAKAFRLSQNWGRLLENQVFVELIRRGYDPEKSLFYYRSRNDKETDFVIKEGFKVTRLIQVCYSLENKKCEQREVSSLVECAEELGCKEVCIVTFQEERLIEYQGYTIRVSPIEKF